MRHLRPFDLAALAATAALVGCAGSGGRASSAPDVAEAAAPAGAHLDVEHYRVELSLEPTAAERLSGTARVDALATVAAERFDLDGRGFDQVVVRELRRGASSVVLETLRTRAGWTVERPLRAGERITLEVDYTAASGVSADAGPWAKEGARLEPTDWLPVFGGADDRVTLDLVLDHPVDGPRFTAGTSVLVISTGERLRERWRVTVPRALRDLAVVPITGASLGKDPLQDPAYAFVSERLGRCVPYAVELGPYDVALGPGDVERESPPLSAVVSTAREWFGGLIVPASDDDRWLVDALARYVGALFEEEVRGVEPGVAARSAEDAALGSAAGARGVGRLHLLRHVLGDEGFDASLRRLVGRTAQGELSVNDLREAAEFSARRELGDVFDTWFVAPVVPDVEVAWRYDAARQRILVRVEQVHALDDGAPAAFPLAAELQIGATVDDALQVRRHSVDVRARRELLEVACDEPPRWVTFDGHGWLPISVRYDRSPDEARLVGSEHPSRLAREAANAEVRAGGRSEPQPFASVGEAVDDR